MLHAKTPTAHVEANAPKPERTPNGRFAKGNGGGPGNPFGRKLAQFRQALLSTITDDDIKRVGKLLLEMALARDVAAMRLFLQYAVGKPQAVAEPDRVDIEEWKLALQSVVPTDVAEETFAAMPITVGIATLPALAEVRERQFVDMMLHPEKYPTPQADGEPTAEELAEDAEMLREYRAARAAEEAAERGRAAASAAIPPAESSVAVQSAKVPAGDRQQTGNVRTSIPRPERADAASELGVAPSPIGPIGATRGPVPSRVDSSGRQESRATG